MFSNNPFSKHRANNEALNETKYLIPEEIPANERTAFHGAAAGAAKDGKTSFSFSGKKYPVTMDKGIAKNIADQKEAVVKTGYGIRNKVSDMPGVDYSWRDKYKGAIASKDAVKKARCTIRRKTS